MPHPYHNEEHPYPGDVELTPAEAFDEQRRDYGDAYRVSSMRGEAGDRYWVVLDPEGEPVESFRTREDAQACRDAIAASYREPIPE